MVQERDSGKLRNPRRRKRDGDSRRSRRPENEDSVIEGRNPVVEALRAGRSINKILLSTGASQTMAIEEILRLAKEKGTPVERVERRVIDRRSVTGKSQGVLALAGAMSYADLDDVLEVGPARGEPPLLVLLDGIQDPHNLGAIIRTADAVGVHGVVIPERRSAGLSAGVARSSAGAVEHVAVARVRNLSDTLAGLAKDDIWTVGIDPKGGPCYLDVDYRVATAVVVGAEGKGLSRLVRERCDTLAHIPMRGKVESLNASVSAALVMYEAMRQRSVRSRPYPDP